MLTNNIIRVISVEQAKGPFKNKWACAVILTSDSKILLQQRSEHRKNFPSYISAFGGRIEEGEEPLEAMIRELKEELSADVDASEIISLGPITEAITNHSEVVYTYFWHDKNGIIGECLEDTPIYFDNVQQVCAHPKIMDFIIWALEACKSNGLLNDKQTSSQQT